MYAGHDKKPQNCIVTLTDRHLNINFFGKKGTYNLHLTFVFDNSLQKGNMLQIDGSLILAS